MNNTVHEPVPRLRDRAAAEALKLLTHPVAPAALALTTAANILFAAVAIDDEVRFGVGDQLVPLSEFNGVMFAPVYVFLLLPVHAAASEYHGGQFRMSLTAVPDRRAFVAGKLTATVAAVLVGALVALAPGRLVIGLSGGLGAGELLLDLARWVAAYLAMAVVAFGLAGVLRSTVASLAILVMVPVFVGTGVLQWPEGLRFLPDQAAMSLLGTPAYDVTELPAGAAALTLALWVSVAVAGYTASLLRRDS